jgi:hypothetical protein
MWPFLEPARRPARGVPTPKVPIPISASRMTLHDLSLAFFSIHARLLAFSSTNKKSEFILMRHASIFLNQSPNMGGD